MELWIRSQDKTDLVKVNALWIMDNQIWMEVPFYENHKKLGLTVTGHNHKLAEYKTKERALEVLDEIEKILMPEIKVVHNKVERKDLDGFRAEYIMQPMIEDVQVLEASSYVYKMPKE